MAGSAEPREPVAEVTEIPDGAKITVELPGVSQDGIKMEVSGRMIKIDAEGSRGKFGTIQAVSFDPDPDRMSVTFTQGVLEILLLTKGAPTTELPRPGPDVQAEPAALQALQSELDRVTSELNRISEERASLQLRVANLQKDFQNLRRRHEEEKHLLAERRVEDIALSLIDVLDNFERAKSGMEANRSKRPGLDQFVKGMNMIEGQIRSVFTQLGIASIEAVGKQFDPASHECLETVQFKGKPDMEIVAEKQKGYTYRGKVLRPACVVVNRVPECEKKETKNDVRKD